MQPFYLRGSYNEVKSFLMEHFFTQAFPRDFFYFCSITSSFIFHKYSMAWKRMHNQKNLTPLCLNWKVSILSSLVILIYIFRAIRSTGTIQNFWILTVYRTVSIKRPHLNFFQKSLLNVRYDRKNEGLNILSTRSYNRVVRVPPCMDKKKKIRQIKVVIRYSHHSIIRPGR